MVSTSGTQPGLLYRELPNVSRQRYPNTRVHEHEISIPNTEGTSSPFIGSGQEVPPPLKRLSFGLSLPVVI